MKSFACLSVILLARSVVSENIPFCAPAQVKYCVLDDCLQPLINQTTFGPQFCGKYFENDSISIPDYIPTTAPASRISSACSCLIQAQPTTKPTAHSSYVPGSIGLSVSTKTFPSLETSVPPIPSAIVSSVPVSSPGTPEAGNEYTTSIIYSLSAYTTHLSGQLVTKNRSVVDSTTVYPATHEITQSPSPKSTASVEYTTSIVYTLSSYTNLSGEVVTKTIVDYTTVCPVTTKTTSSSQALGELASESTTAYETSTIYKVSTYTTLGQTITKTLIDYSTVRSITKALSPSPTPKSTIEYTTLTIYSLSTRTYTSSEKTFTVTDFPLRIGYSVSSTAYVIANSTSSEILPTSTSRLEINSSTSELPETTETPITSAPSTKSSPVLPSVTAFCSTDAAALYLQQLPTYSDEQYLFVTKTTLITTTTTVSPATVTVFKRTTRSDPFPFTSTYDLAQQSSACSCLSIQPAVIAETVAITVPATLLVVVSTTIPAFTPSPTQVVINGDFETATSGSYQTPWVLGSMAYVESNVNNAFRSYAGDEFAVLIGQRATTTTISQQIDILIPGQSYTLSYYTSVMGIITLPTASCVLSASVGGIIVDTATITYSNIASYRTGYSQRSVTVIPTTQSAQLKIAWQCSSQLLLTRIFFWIIFRWLGRVRVAVYLLS
ncbi:hypothetical protein BCON_0017g00130 [Botryotinia convoluta]|uniref:PA14 domain-containing protein n=1 Tax=Botryotinia convoluta TaxID=54673 RepID=A0A4Z1IQB2_9HELO|nr:hypothetical protein BCON_0017g00130 [Botryotinia convoluta]